VAALPEAERICRPNQRGVLPGASGGTALKWLVRLAGMEWSSCCCTWSWSSLNI